jgi:hypothetical protein
MRKEYAPRRGTLSTGTSAQRRVRKTATDEDGPESAARAFMSESPKAAQLLRKLMRACVDDERTLRHEHGFVDGERGTVLARLARERRQFVLDLEALAAPGQSELSGSWGELMREVGRNLQVAAAGKNGSDAIATCRHSRRRTEDCYDRALRRPCSDEMSRVLESHRARLHEEADALRRIQF